MTRRQDLKHYRHSLGEIREIMNSMKTLAYMETRKLSRFIEAQHNVVATLERVAKDFLSFYPQTLSEMEALSSLYLIVGSERGFCGDLNQTLIRHVEAVLKKQSVGKTMLMTVGRRLHGLVAENVLVNIPMDGANIVEEVSDILGRIVQQLAVLQQQNGVFSVYVIYYANEGIRKRQLIPPFQDCLPDKTNLLHPPALNLTPETFMLGLAEQYLFAVLHEVLYVSLMSENHHRMLHLEGAVKHLDGKLDNIARRYNLLRQEEIIEEIEIILLNSGSA